MLIGWRAANMLKPELDSCPDSYVPLPWDRGNEHSVIIICCLGREPWRSKAVEQITLDLFQNCDVPEEVSGTFDPEVAVGVVFEDVREGCLWRNFRVRGD